MKKRIIWLAGFMAIPGPLLHAQAGSGGLSGAVSDEAGSRAAATVYYQRLVQVRQVKPGSGRVALGSGEIEMRSTFATNADGTFHTANLPAGDYLVCTRPQDDRYVDSCDWDRPTHITVANGPAAAVPLAPLRQGLTLTIHVLDPQSVLPPVKNPLNTSGLILGVRDAKHWFHPARLKTSGAGYRDYTITIPLQSQVSLWVASRAFAVRNSAGVTAPAAGLATPLQTATSAGSLTVNLTITGRQ